MSMGDGDLSWDQVMNEDYSYFPFNTCIACLVLCSTAYALRLWARASQRVSFGWDDWVMIPSFFTIIGVLVAGLLSALYGSGRHAERVILENDWHFNAWGRTNLWVLPFLYLPAVTLPKLSILILYLRIFTDRFSRWTSWVTIIGLVVNMVVNYITIGLQCDTFDDAWQPWLWPGHCENIVQHFSFGSIPNIVTDVVMLLLPLPAVLRLRVDRHVKLGLWATLSLGSFGLITAVLRIVEFLQNNFDMDATWYGGSLVAWTALETSVYFISACMVTYRPLLTRLLHSSGVNFLVSRVYPSRLRSRSPGRSSGGQSGQTEKRRLFSRSSSGKRGLFSGSSRRSSEKRGLFSPSSERRGFLSPTSEKGGFLSPPSEKGALFSQVPVNGDLFSPARASPDPPRMSHQGISPGGQYRWEVQTQAPVEEPSRPNRVHLPWPVRGRAEHVEACGECDNCVAVDIRTSISRACASDMV